MSSAEVPKQYLYMYYTTLIIKISNQAVTVSVSSNALSPWIVEDLQVLI